MTPDPGDKSASGDNAGKLGDHRVLLGDQQCPRCQKHFTVSYWSGNAMVQARCLSCDLKWPRPDVV